jgi:hypothetical protein
LKGIGSKESGSAIAEDIQGIGQVQQGAFMITALQLLPRQ